MRELRPDLNARVLQRAAHQFALYLAGLCFWSGDLVAAVRWRLRSGCRLPVLAAPHVVRMLLNRHRRKPALQTMRPGITLDTRRTPEPLLPYDKIRAISSPGWCRKSGSGHEDVPCLFKWRGSSLLEFQTGLPTLLTLGARTSPRCVILPFSVFWSKAVLHLQRIDKAFPGYVFAKGKVPFPIGELDLYRHVDCRKWGVFKEPLNATGGLRGWIKPKI
jgi:hypothetical protein